MERIVQATCCQCENNRKSVGRQLCLDLGKYRRICGITGEVRYLCAHHSRGLKGSEAFAAQR